MQPIIGLDFDEIMFQLLYSKVKIPLDSIYIACLRKVAEFTKVELSITAECMPELFVGDDYVDMHVTRREFEEASKSLLQKTIDATKKILEDHPNQKPEIILLTGGASQMPMVKRELEKAIPEYRDKIIYFRPERTVAYGAARYGTVERRL